ncbi:MAG: Co2+/Mg2+ efflux protein ApaG [Pseudomonadota bacterium]|jgi:ApaG protein
MEKRRIAVSVNTQFLPHESNPQDQVFTFAYTVTITNHGSLPAQVLGRHWVIEDAAGHRQEVRGLGVVGQQPYLQPGESFEYTSGTRIRSALGSMHGRYVCISDDAEVFEADIPVFALKAPEDLPGRQASQVVLH